MYMIHVNDEFGWGRLAVVKLGEERGSTHGGYVVLVMLSQLILIVTSINFIAIVQLYFLVH